MKLTTKEFTKKMNIQTDRGWGYFACGSLASRELLVEGAFRETVDVLESVFTKFRESMTDASATDHFPNVGNMALTERRD